MSQPTPYNRQTNFEEYATEHPEATFPPADLDAELDAVETTLDAILTNLALIQADDGGIANGVVDPDSFSTAALSLIAADWDPKGNWITGSAYTIGDLVQNASGGVTTSYVCAVSHTSGTLATDVTAGKWVTLGATIAGSAASITFSPTGTIAATDVQAAIAEAAGEALQIANNLSDVGSAATSRSNLAVPSKAEIQQQTHFCASAGGTANTITASFTPAITSLVDKMRVVVVAGAANSSATPTFTPNSGVVTAKTIVKGANSPLVAADIPGQYAVAILQYNSTLDKWVLVNPASVSGAVAKVGDTMTGALIMSGAPINTAYGADVTSASSIDLDNVTGNNLNISGTTTIGTVTLTEGRSRICRATGAWKLTHSSSLLCPGAQDFQAASGDVVLFLGLASSVVLACVIRKVNGAPVAGRERLAQGRLTLTTATPVTTADVTAATTIYFTPFRGNTIELYNGSYWYPYTFTELSLSVPATTNTLYDVYLYDNAGTLTLDATAWSSDTARATALKTQDGILVKTGATGRRYLGCFRTTGSSGQTEDSYAKRYVWNYYNRIHRPMKVVDTTNSWAYTLATYQQANNSAANQLDFVIGVSEDAVEATVYGAASNSTGNQAAAVGIGLDNLTNVADIQYGAAISTVTTPFKAMYRAPIAVGRHILTWLEASAASGTTTWYGDNNSTYIKSGIVGQLLG